MITETLVEFGSLKIGDGFVSPGNNTTVFVKIDDYRCLSFDDKERWITNVLPETEVKPIQYKIQAH